MKIEKIQDFSLKDIILVSSLPDMGKVGGLVTEHLAKKLGTKVSSKITLSDKPWVEHKSGVIDLPKDEYTLSVDEKNSVVVFTGKNQPQDPKNVFEMVDYVLDEASKMGSIKMVISSGGYFPREKKDDQVFGVATNQKVLSLLKLYNIPFLDSDVNSITWFNGLILGHAKIRNIDGVGLFGQIEDTETPQYKAASNIVKIISRILSVEINTKELDENISEKPKETKKSSPGVG